MSPVEYKAAMKQLDGKIFQAFGDADYKQLSEAVNGFTGQRISKALLVDIIRAIANLEQVTNGQFKATIQLSKGTKPAVTK